jgi:hypothetical protein
VTTTLLWFGLLGGITAWAAHLVLSYAVVALGCAPLGEMPVRVLLFVVTVLAGLIAVSSLFAARRIHAGGTTWRRSFARAGVLLDALGLFGIAVAGTVAFALSVC